MPRERLHVHGGENNESPVWGPKKWLCGVLYRRKHLPLESVARNGPLDQSTGDDNSKAPCFVFVAPAIYMNIQHLSRPNTPIVPTKRKRPPGEFFAFGEHGDSGTPETRRPPKAVRLLPGRVQTASRALPFLRRRLTTLLPDALFIRARKPCVFLRFRFFGWYVTDIGPSIGGIQKNGKRPKYGVGLQEPVFEGPTLYFFGGSSAKFDTWCRSILEKMLYTFYTQVVNIS